MPDQVSASVHPLTLSPIKGSEPTLSMTVAFKHGLRPSERHIIGPRAVEALVSAVSSPAQRSPYTPLKPWQTRLVKLLPGDFDDVLRCELQVAEITFHDGMGIGKEGLQADYEALSYSWGRPNLSATIMVNGLPTPIPPAMEQALRYMRLLDSPRRLWCDAICINQLDATEKSKQVEQMLIIFAKARRVVAWLGLPDGLDFEATQDPDPWKQDRAQAFVARRLSERGWFNRVWVQQEVFAARDLLVQCGSYVLPPLIFEQTSGWTLLQHINHLDFSELWQRRDIDVPDSAERQGAIHSLVDLIGGDGVGLEASDDRDRLFAILEMANNMHRQAFRDIKINYAKSYANVCREFTKYLLRHTKTLTWITDIRIKRSDSGHASWSLDLRYVRERTQLPFKSFDDWGHHSIATNYTPHPLWLDSVAELWLDEGLILSGYPAGILGDRIQFAGVVEVSGNSAALLRGHMCTNYKADLLECVRQGPYKICQIQHRGIPMPATFLGVPSFARKGDHIVSMRGSDSPIVIRRLRQATNSSPKYGFIGAGILYYSKPPWKFPGPFVPSWYWSDYARRDHPVIEQVHAAARTAAAELQEFSSLSERSFQLEFGLTDAAQRKFYQIMRDEERVSTLYYLI